MEKETTPDCDKLLRDIQAGCHENCADCDYSKGIEFECSILSECAQAIAALQAKTERLTAERDDTLELLHAYRHICGEREPNELSQLVTADDEGRCMVVPFQIEQKVRHGVKGWTGRVKEFIWNSDGLAVYVACDECTECVRPDELVPM